MTKQYDSLLRCYDGLLNLSLNRGQDGLGLIRTPHADYICISQILKLFQFVTCIADIKSLRIMVEIDVVPIRSNI